MKKLFLTAIDWFLPDSYKNRPSRGHAESERRRTARLAIGLTFLVIPVLALVWMSEHFLSRATLTSPMLLSLMLGFSLSLFVNKIYGFFKQTTWIFLMFTILLVPLRMLEYGGFSSTAVAWYCLAPVIAGMILGKRAVYIVFGLSLLTLTPFVVPEWLGLQVVKTEVSQLFQFISFASMLMVLSVITAIYDEQRRSYLDLLHTKTTILKRANANIEQLNMLLQTMIDSIGQGFLIFDAEGNILDPSTRACESLLEGRPSGRPIWKVLNLEGEDEEIFKHWMKLTFQGVQRFEDMAGLAPSYYEHSEGKKIRLQYYPIFQAEALVYIVLVATDETKLFFAQEEAKREKLQAEMVLKMAKNGHLYVKFDQTFKNYVDLIQTELAEDILDTHLLGQLLHALKGSASCLSMVEIVDKCHELEECLTLLKKNSDEEYYKVLHQMRTKTREMVGVYTLFVNQFESLVGINFEKEKSFKKVTSESLYKFFLKLQRSKTSKQIVQEFHNEFIKGPIGEHFEHYNEVIKDLAIRRGKSIGELVIKGGELKIDAHPFLDLFESIGHAVRNAVDHGLETSTERKKLGKSSKGKVEISFEIEKDKIEWLNIYVKDDGRGIDPDIIRKKLVQQGKSSIVDGKDDQQILQLILTSEFSTKDFVDDISGRGVGTDIIKTLAENLGGYVLVESVIAKGTCLKIHIPLYPIERDRLKMAS